MSIDSKEKSAYDAAAVELYYYACNTQNWAYADWDQDFSIDNMTYLCLLPHKRNEPEFSEEQTHAQLEITTTIEHPVVNMMITGVPHDPIWVTVYRAMLGESTKIMKWQGKVVSARTSSASMEAVLICEPVEQLMGKSGFRQTFGPSCRKRLYSPACGVSEAAYTTDFIVENVSANGLVVTSSAFSGRDANWWRYGDIWIPSLRRWGSIESSSGNIVTLRARVSGLEIGHAGKVRPGCDHLFKRSNGDWGDCKGKFDNAINFGGFAHTGIKNPYVIGLEG